jgi:iron(III) transport system permease protein
MNSTLKNRVVKSLSVHLDSWSTLSVILVIGILSPLILVTRGIFLPVNETFSHLMDTVLTEYVVNTFIICIGVGIFTSVIGVGTAWFVSVYEFPLRRFYSWGLILPLAIPTYIAGYIYGDMFSYTGSIMYLLRKYLGYNKNIDIMNIWGVIGIFTFFFYPYVFIVMKSFFAKESSTMIEASQSLGKSMGTTFFKIILPLSRVSLVGGVSLVLMEVLNAYGLVSHFGVTTFSTGIFRTWLSLGDLDASIKLSSILVVIVFAILNLEKAFRGRRSYSFSSTKVKPIKRRTLSRGKALAISGGCTLIFAIGFAIPVIQLLAWARVTYTYFDYEELLEVLGNSLSVTLLASIIIVVVAVIIANSVRLNKLSLSKFLSKGANLGYSIPGAVIAIGVMSMFIGVDRKFQGIYRLMGIDKTLVLSSSFVILVFAYMVRFLAVPYNSIESGFDKVGVKFHEASRTFGFGVTKTFMKVDFPMIKSSIGGALILVFIEIVKELPLTLILRPFNFQTLSTFIQQYANDEMIQESSIPSLLLVGMCAVAVYAFTNMSKKKEN